MTSGREVKPHSREWEKKHPFYGSFYNAFRRCNNPTNNRYQYYGAKGIKCNITFYEVGYLWYRDKAYEMKKPNLHRIINTGNYEVNNCCFIEASEHNKITHTGRKVTIESRLKMSKSAGKRYGENHPQAKLTSIQVAEIKLQLGFKIKGARLAEEYGVAESTISAIKKNLLWKKG